MKRNELKSIGISATLILVNIGLMGLVGQLPQAAMILDILFSYVIIGVVVFGAILTAGTYLAERGVREEDLLQAGIGVALLQIGYGVFGGGAVALLEPSVQVTVLAITAVVTAVIAVAAAALVYGTRRDFSGWRRYANYAFLGVLVLAFVGTFAAPLVILAFLLALSGFLALLVYEIWDMRVHGDKVVLNGIGIYNAFMGVFVHILRIVIELYLRRR